MTHEARREPEPEDAADAHRHDHDREDGEVRREAQLRGLGVLRETRACFLPRDVRRGLALALPEICDLALNEGMETLEEHPALALARGIVDDLEVALAAVDELEELVREGSSGTDEMAALVAVKSVAQRLAPQVRVLRQLESDLRGGLDRAHQAVGEAPAVDGEDA